MAKFFTEAPAASATALAAASSDTPVPGDSSPAWIILAAVAIGIPALVVLFCIGHCCLKQCSLREANYQTLN